MNEDDWLEMRYENLFSVEDESDFNARDFDQPEQDDAECLDWCPAWNGEECCC